MRRYPPVLVTPPADTPVTLAEAKAYMGITDSADDTAITSAIQAATARLDGRSGLLGRCLVSQTWRQTFDRFEHCLRLGLPALSVTSITYLDGAGASVAVAAETYALRQDGRGSLVEEAYGHVWPVPADRSEAVTVTFVAGYGAASAVPAALREAIMMIVKRRFEGARRDATLVTDRTDGVGTWQWDNSGALARVADDDILAQIAPYRRYGS